MRMLVAAAIGIPAEFCLLNARGRDEQPHRVDASRGNVGEQIDELRRMLKRNGPTGDTCTLLSFSIGPRWMSIETDSLQV
eukprot:SAG31_NODE_73_length_27793_cov_26.900520_7_plen_80_part_00